MWRKSGFLCSFLLVGRKYHTKSFQWVTLWLVRCPSVGIESENQTGKGWNRVLQDCKQRRRFYDFKEQSSELTFLFSVVDLECVCRSVNEQAFVCVQVSEWEVERDLCEKQIQSTNTLFSSLPRCRWKNVGGVTKKSLFARHEQTFCAIRFFLQQSGLESC